MSLYHAPKVPTILTKTQRYHLHTWLSLDLQGHTLEEIREHFEVTQGRRREAKKVREAKAREARKEALKATEE
ncbi:hypothetical protein JFT60_26025 [Pseudomonas sp. MF6772]|uniref:hypothetical protein n=1 Tax=Pseudomonas sp. MF6772 TaxID=2797533 RepID=UPI0018E777D2|nr:hypothetical protein [Pseudomonas sp. MF6772]MBJ2270840.1 hypothetical protein [Pseudomonas sp. MF6772]